MHGIVKLFDFKNNEVTLDFGFYPAGEPYIKFEEDPEDLQYMVLRPRNIADFVAGMFLADSVTERGGHLRELSLNCVPGARQDRINPTGDTLFTAKSIAQMINARDFDRVHIFDPHSPVISALIDRVVVHQPWEEYQIKYAFRRDYSALVAPDAGAIKRTEAMASVLNLPVIQASKTRDVSTGALSGFSIGIVPPGVFGGSKVLVFDDLCDGGWTFTGLGKALAESGLQADLYVSHGIFSKGLEELKKHYGHIFTTDSFPNGITDPRLTTFRITY